MPEVDALVRSARSDQAFLNKFLRVDECTATDVMCRDIKSKVFDILTCVKQDGLKALVETILDAREDQVITAKFEIDKAKGDKSDCVVTGKRAADEPPLYEPLAVRAKH
ncbi:hypothetical protein RBB50_009049 [Rhinocladiella similis]